MCAEDGLLDDRAKVRFISSDRVSPNWGDLLGRICETKRVHLFEVQSSLHSEPLRISCAQHKVSVYSKKYK